MALLEDVNKQGYVQVKDNLYLPHPQYCEAMLNIFPLEIDFDKYNNKYCKKNKVNFVN